MGSQANLGSGRRGIAMPGTSSLTLMNETWRIAARKPRDMPLTAFRSDPVPTPHGPRHACIGVFTIDGKTAGAFARLSPAPLISAAAIHTAVLVDRQRKEPNDA